MNRIMRRVIAFVLLAASSVASAQDVLIRNATVHTASTAGTLRGSDVLVQGGLISAIGNALAAPAGIAIVDANGAPLTPGLFAGVSGIGVEEVSAEPSANDGALVFGATVPQAAQMRPEFDVTLAYNPRSSLLPVARMGGLSFTQLAAGSALGGSIIAGQGAVVRLDGRFDGIPFAEQRALFINLGGNLAPLSGNSRAGAYMLLAQAIAEARSAAPAGSVNTLLTPAGRSALAGYFARGRVLVGVDRAADILRVIAIAQREKLNIVLVGAAEGWLVAAQLAAAKVPVLIDGLENLPGSFDSLGATLENAARLHAAGVAVGFSQRGDASHNARKMRQLAGNAVANGLPWEAGLAGLTAMPAKALGVSHRIGSIEVGKLADLVLWSGDPLEVTNSARQIWLAGKAMPMQSRQTQLRDRYLRAAGPLPRAYP
ncbi:MAG: amidohydrolase [Lysobacterales bacterium CG17_big_fil_post_rev_8_21_14_2_50_64_11]|nr:MAG: amidohydrolase [Xanthomonadales bacterium CG17_big_fil_post_rev_8_21_14_2_50_64_11]